MDLKRSSGILLHPTSLPGRFGIGDLGPEALRFHAGALSEEVRDRLREMTEIYARLPEQ